MPATPAIDLQRLRRSADQAGRLLKALGNPDRLLLLCMLSQEELHVGALEERVGIGQPTLSQQLGVLREAGVVETRREAKQIFYRLTEARAAQLIEALYGIFCAPEGRS